jgi:hypothetical protein
MARKIKITKNQLAETTEKLNVEVEKGNGSWDAAIKQKQDQLTQLNVDPKDVNLTIDENLKESRKILTKAQILESRRQYLYNKSTHYSKKSFLKR